ncbi:hypothetical protein MCOR27_010672 [Pyricularia oryzae]|uniref:Uncharacterized protein n=1 Tax=Pyricularia grisea TaxID=148305 RepID=A0ABQ8N9U1_PYRGI|nr:hypothetical protein MCOR27_010672 [Pyricularia oryzae]KAI6293617.1 hypothetical protein MCOR33_008992 [Pyricularia grisea]KAI6346756.1 hypothetical protein MCOR28_002804 [Pyricularia oryzae]KAI6380022.1 hypothetical protein MCOR32_004277 [Pyricularia oryzae]KAI6408961.1 hypothetical protein MCOR20_005204 [Pyricularia oryzae]
MDEKKTHTKESRKASDKKGSLVTTWGHDQRNDELLRPLVAREFMKRKELRSRTGREATEKGKRRWRRVTPNSEQGLETPRRSSKYCRKCRGRWDSGKFRPLVHVMYSKRLGCLAHELLYPSGGVASGAEVDILGAVATPDWASNGPVPTKKNKRLSGQGPGGNRILSQRPNTKKRVAQDEPRYCPKRPSKRPPLIHIKAKRTWQQAGLEFWWI